MTCGCDFHPTMIAAGRLLASRRSARPAWKRRESISSSRTAPMPTCRSRLPAPYRVFRRIRTSTRIYSPRYSRRGAVSGCGASGDGAGFRVFRHGDICELRYRPPGSMFPHRAPGWMDPPPAPHVAMGIKNARILAYDSRISFGVGSHARYSARYGVHRGRACVRRTSHSWYHLERYSRPGRIGAMRSTSFPRHAGER